VKSNLALDDFGAILNGSHGCEVYGGGVLTEDCYPPRWARDSDGPVLGVASGASVVLHRDVATSTPGGAASVAAGLNRGAQPSRTVGLGGTSTACSCSTARGTISSARSWVEASTTNAAAPS